MNPRWRYRSDVNRWDVYSSAAIIVLIPDTRDDCREALEACAFCATAQLAFALPSSKEVQ